MRGTEVLSSQYVKTTGQSQRNMKSYIFITLGFSFLLSLLMKIPYVILDSAVPSQISTALWLLLIYLSYALVFVIVIVISSHVFKTNRYSNIRTFLLILSGCLYAIAVLFNMMVLPELSPFFIFIPIVIYACFGSLHLYAWGAQIIILNPKTLPLCLSISFALTSLFSFGSSLITDILDIIFPLASFVLLLLLKWPARQVNLSEHASLRHAPWGIISICAVLIIVWLMSLGLLSLGHSSELNESGQLTIYLISMAIVIILACYYVLIIHKDNASKRNLFLYPFVVLALANIAIISYIVVDQFDNFILFKELFIIVVHCMDVLMFLLIAYSVAIRRLSYIALFTIYTLLLSSSPWMILSRYIQSLDVTMTSTTPTNLAAMGLSFITSLALVFLILRFTARSDDIELTLNNPRSNVSNIFELISSTYGLTGKEVEVLSLLYRGYSSKHAAQELHVSDNTIRSHTTAIYRKLSVHSKQELIDFIDAYHIDE